MKIVFSIIICSLIILGGCSTKKPPSHEGESPPTEISYNQIQKCYVHKDYVACRLTTGDAFFITTKNYEKVLAEKTSWDCTLWKEGGC